MKCNYKGFELSVTREKCLGGWDQVYIWAYHDKLGEVICDHCDDSDTIASHMKYLKKTIDDMIANPNDWDFDEEDCKFIKSFYSKKYYIVGNVELETIDETAVRGGSGNCLRIVENPIEKHLKK